jgi:hypothetical protein
MWLWLWLCGRGRHLLGDHVIFDELVEFCDVRVVLIKDFARIHVIDLKAAEPLKSAP